MEDIHSLARNGDAEGLEKLLEPNEEPEAKRLAGKRDLHKRIPLHLAAFFGHVDSVKALLKFSDPNSEATDGFTSLHFAAQRGHAGVVRLLLQHTKVDRKTYKGQTPFHLACSKARSDSGQLQVIQILLSKDCDVTLKTKQGKSWRELCCDDVIRDVIGKLIEDTQSNEKKRALEYDSECSDSASKINKVS
jgi:ankyrin repeat protein